MQDLFWTQQSTEQVQYSTTWSAIKSWPHHVNYCYRYQLGTVFVNGMEPVALILNQILTKEKGNDLLGAEKAYDC